jgi:hypothetical protein
MDSTIGETARLSQLLDPARRHPRHFRVIAARRTGLARLRAGAAALFARVERNGPRHKRIEIPSQANSAAAF